MRVLLVHPGPDFSVHDVYLGWYEALKELGVEVIPFNLNDRLVYFSNAMVPTGEDDETGHPIYRAGMNENQVFMASMEGLSHALLSVWPDIVLMTSGFFMTAGMMQLMRARNFKIALLATEAPYQDSDQILRAQQSDLVMLNDPATIDKYREHTKAEYLPHAYRPTVHYPRTGPRNPELSADLTFIGTAFESRVRFFEQLDLDGLDVLVAGNDWGKLSPESPAAKWVGTPLGEADCVDNLQTAELYRNARMGLNFYRREATPEEKWDGQAFAMGPREVEMSAIGLPFLRDPRPEGDEVLSMLPTFDGPEDASEKLKWYLDPQRAWMLENLGRQAREAIADRTFTANAKRFLKLAEDL